MHIVKDINNKMVIKRSNKKGVSPIIVTILIIAIVLVLASIIFIWARSFIKEDIQKFNPPISISKACDEVDLIATFEDDGNSIRIVNNAPRVPIYKIKINTESEGSKEVIDFPESIDLSPAQSKLIDVSSYQNSDQNIVSITPVLKGIKKEGEAEFVCDKTIIVS